MPDNQQGNSTDVVKKLTTWPINLQSLAQSVGLLGVLIGGVLAVDRRITTLELNFKHQSDILAEQRQLLREARDDQKRALANQDEILKRGERPRKGKE
jgi:hypothetical protein